MVTVSKLGAARCAGVALVALMLVPTGSAYFWDSWFDTDSSDVAPPEPVRRTDDVDLARVAGVVGVVQVSDVTALTALSYPDVEILLRPVTGHMEVVMIPKPASSGLPTQVTTINTTVDLTLVHTPYFTWIDGDDAQVPGILEDISVIFDTMVPDVAVQNPAVMRTLIPTTKTGVGTVVKTEYDLFNETLARSRIVFSVLDVDDVVKMVEVGTEYEGAGITLADTAVENAALLDGLAITGASLSGVLSGLSISTEKVGVVDVSGVAEYLEDDGYVLREVVNESYPTGVFISPNGRTIDFVNPADLAGEVVLLNTKEISSVSESSIIALKDVDAGKDTRILSQLSLPATDIVTPVPCMCFVEYVYDATVGGIVSAFATLDRASVQATGVVMRARFDPEFEIPQVAPASAVDWDLADVSYVSVLGDRASSLSTGKLASILQGDVVEPPTGSSLPSLHNDTVVFLDPPADLSAAELDALTNMVDEWKAASESFTFLACRTCLADDTWDSLFRYLGQLETFAPTHTIAVPESRFDADMLGVVMAVSGQVLLLSDEASLNQDMASIQSTVNFRAITYRTSVPVADVDFEVQVSMPGAQGSTVQTYTGTTNDFGYVAISMLPTVAYNFTAEHADFDTYTSVGASPAPGETDGKDVRMNPVSGVYSWVEKVATREFLLWSLAGLVGFYFLWRYAKKRRNRVGG